MMVKEAGQGRGRRAGRTRGGELLELAEDVVALLLKDDISVFPVQPPSSAVGVCEENSVCLAAAAAGKGKPLAELLVWLS